MATSVISARKYRKLRRMAVRLLSDPDILGSTAERAVRQAALAYIPLDLPDREEHAADLAIQAACDGAAATGRLDEFNAPDW